MPEAAALVCSSNPLRDVRTLFAHLCEQRDVLLLPPGERLPLPPPRLPRRRGDRHILLATSGTGGAPKIVVHSLVELLKSARRTLDFYGVGREDIWPLNLPLYHIAGLQIVLRCALAKIPLRLDDSKATIMSLVPTQLVRLMETPGKLEAMKKMKAILVGGAPLEAALWERAIQERLPVSPTYGLTEAGSQVAAIKPTDFLAGQKRMQILPGKKVKLIKGRLALAGEGVMRGMLSADGALEQSVVEEGFFLTSDMAKLSGGRLSIRGRCDRTIISGGKNLNPARLESLALEHPQISQAAALGLPDSHWGERLHLAYVAERELDLEELKNFLRQSLPSWHLPKGISRHRHFPMSGIKIDYGKLRDLLAQP